MKVTFLGSGGGSGIPNPFCQCVNCEAARAAGGRSLRNSPAVLINDDLLIDCGADVDTSARTQGVRLHALRSLVITHRHSDHLDPWFFWERRGVAGTELPLLTVYAPQDALDEIDAFYQANVGWDRAALETQTRIACRVVRPGMLKIAGRYRLHFFPAAHGDATLSAVLVGVKDVRAAYLHAYDSGPFSDETWTQLAAHHFDAVAIDACIGQQADFHSDQHMTGPQTVAHAARLRETGILKPGGVVLATHFVHQSAGDHADLLAYYEPQGVGVAYDGLTLALGEGQDLALVEPTDVAEPVDVAEPASAAETPQD